MADFFNNTTALTVAVIILTALFIISLILIFVFFSRYSSAHTAAQKNKSYIRSMLPSKIGDIDYYNYTGYSDTIAESEEDIEDDNVARSTEDEDLPIGTIIMQPSALLSRVNGNELSTEFVKFFDVMDEFYEDPAAELDKFYEPKSHYGFPVQLSRAIPYNSHRHVPIIQTLDGGEYAIVSMKRLPKYLSTIVRLIDPTPSEN